MTVLCEAAEQQDLFDRAMEAARQQNQPRVVSCLQEFIKGSVGDTRIDKAREMLKQTWATYAARLAKEGFSAEAATQYMALAKFLGANSDADEAMRLAKEAVRKGFDAAVKGRRNQDALRLGSFWANSFPKERPLADDTQRLRLKVGALATLMTQKAEPEYIDQALVDVLAEGGVEAAMEDAKLSRWSVDFACAQKMAQRGWQTAAIPTLSELELSAPDDPARKRAQSLTVECLLDAADAWLSLGNVPESARALKACEAYPAMPDRNQRFVKLKRASQRLKGSAQAKTLAFQDPIPGEGTWVDEGGGLRVEGEIRFGRQGKDALKADVTVQAGTLIEGGRLWVEHGRLAFEGLPDRPIILRKVELVCEFVGQVEARNVLFEDCTFVKGGGMFWVGGYSSRWIFNDCLLLRSNFRDLGYNYGLSISNTIFYDCDVPRRQLGKDPAENAAARFLDDQNAVNECTFIRCRVAPSATWMSKQSNFYRCEVAFVPDPFKSTENLEVSIFAPAMDSEFRDRLAVTSSSDDRGQLMLAFANKAFGRPGQSRLWAYAQAPRLIPRPAAPPRPADKQSGAARQRLDAEKAINGQ